MWEATTKFLKNYPKTKTDDMSQLPDNIRRLVIRRSSKNLNPDYEIEDIVNEWSNMTGFLCSTGGLNVTDTNSMFTPRQSYSLSASVWSLESKKMYSTSNASQVEPQYCPVKL